MTNHLWFRLICAFGGVIAVCVIVTVVLTRQGTATQFAHFMVNHQMVQPERLQSAFADYFRTQGSWVGIHTQLPTIVERASDGTMGSMMGGMMGMADNHMQLLDSVGTVVADTANVTNPQPLTGPSVQHWPLMVDGQSVGTLLVEGAMMLDPAPNQANVIAGVTRAVLLAGLTAGVVGLLLAGILVRQFTRPLDSLILASSDIAGGNFKVRVPVLSRDELGALATTFNCMADSLETQETLRRNLMADVAHELRTPLTGIQGTVEAMQDGVFPVTAENLAAIHEQVLWLNHLVEDLRTLANAEAGQLPLERVPVDLAQLCVRRVAAFQPQAAAKSIQLTMQVDHGCGNDTLPIVCGDAQRLGQVLSNLLDNALRHTPEGGAVEIQVAADATVAQLTVLDNGEGIAPAGLAHVFDRFYRADGSRTRSSGGSGLGLAIARQLIEAHGGSIEVASPPPGQQHGSAFTVKLPLMNVP